jgi:hypothetical protein
MPSPSEEEENEFGPLVFQFESQIYARFGPDRGQVLLNDWHIYEIAAAISARFERGRARRILADLNEELRTEQFVDHVEWNETEDGFRPWVLVPMREP